MKQIPGSDLWVPLGEDHLLEMNKRTGRPAWVDYQRDRLDVAYRYVKHFGLAIDVGAHVGLLTRELAKRFEKVIAIEPSESAFACLKKNTAHLPNVISMKAACAHESGYLRYDSDQVIGGNTGNRQLEDWGNLTEKPAYKENSTRVIRLDDLDVDRPVDLIKMDIQGYEYRALRGAEGLLTSFAPILIVEIEPTGKLRRHPDRADRTMELLAGWNAVALEKISADYVIGWGKNGPVPYTKYDRRGDYHWQGYGNNPNAGDTPHDHIARYVRAREKEAAILDVGCGDGLYTKLLGPGTFGIDSNETAIGLAKGRQIDCDVLSIYRLDHLGRRFDVAFMADVFEHLHYQELALKILRASGVRRVYFLNPDPCGSPWHTREFTADELNVFMGEQGWTEDAPRQVWIKKGIAKTLMSFTYGSKP